jgi:hypothetical protein
VFYVEYRQFSKLSNPGIFASRILEVGANGTASRASLHFLTGGIRFPSSSNPYYPGTFEPPMHLVMALVAEKHEVILVDAHLTLDRREARCPESGEPYDGPRSRFRRTSRIFRQRTRSSLHALSSTCRFGRTFGWRCSPYFL